MAAFWSKNNINNAVLLSVQKLAARAASLKRTFNFLPSQQSSHFCCCCCSFSFNPHLFIQCFHFRSFSLSRDEKNGAVSSCTFHNPPVTNMFMFHEGGAR